jgi:antitoxin CptB
MTLNIDLLKKKIIYRSNYRGTKEMDKLLGSFTKKYIEILSLEDLNDLEKLLDIDDTDLYNYYNGLNCDFEFKENYINSLFKTSNMIVRKINGEGLRFELRKELPLCRFSRPVHSTTLPSFREDCFIIKII